MKINILALLLLLGCCSIISFAQVKKLTKIKAAVAKEQTVFGSETEITNKVKLPDDVLKQLGEYGEGALKKCQAAEWRKPNESDHFAASKINLNGDEKPDLIVQAQSLCFMGAHNTTFWIFTDVNERLSPGFEPVFDVRTDFMEILKTSSNGYRDIETISHTAIELYITLWKFDGNTYQPRECKIQKIGNKESTRVRCQQ